MCEAPGAGYHANSTTVSRRPLGRERAALSNIASQIRKALDAGLNTEALDRVRVATIESPDSAELRYLGALASARMGATADAERLLEQIDRDGLGSSPLAVEVW